MTETLKKNTVHLITLLNNQINLTEVENEDQFFYYLKQPISLHLIPDRANPGMMTVNIAPFHPMIEDAKSSPSIMLGKAAIQSVLPLSNSDPKQKNMIDIYRQATTNIVMPTMGEVSAIRR